MDRTLLESLGEQAKIIAKLAAEISRLHEKVSRYEAIHIRGGKPESPAAGLRAIADWLTAQFPDSDKDVQTDLYLWADQIEAGTLGRGMDSQVNSPATSYAIERLIALRRQAAPSCATKDVAMLAAHQSEIVSVIDAAVASLLREAGERDRLSLALAYIDHHWTAVDTSVKHRDGDRLVSVTGKIRVSKGESLADAIVVAAKEADFRP